MKRGQRARKVYSRPTDQECPADNTLFDAYSYDRTKELNDLRGAAGGTYFGPCHKYVDIWVWTVMFTSILYNLKLEGFPYSQKFAHYIIQLRRNNQQKKNFNR